jgi:hypothetical protein
VPCDGILIIELVYVYGSKVLMSLVVVILLAILVVGGGGFVDEIVSFEREKEAEGADGEEAEGGGFYGSGGPELVELGLECDGEALPRLLSVAKLLSQARPGH